MKSVSLKSASFLSAIAIAAVSTAAVRAQAPQAAAAPSAAATTQGPTNVNVVNVPTVTVGNTELQPIPVKEPTKEPVHANFTGTVVPSIGVTTLGTYAVPAGKRLVVEHFLAACRSETENSVRAQMLHGTVFLTFLPLTSVPFLNFPGQVTASGALPVSAYIDEGTVAVQVTRTSTNGNTYCTATVLGYLTPLS